MTLTDLTNTLKTLDAQSPIVFSTPTAQIGGGYYVTELKALQITSIDCAGRASEWNEAALQLLDGNGTEHMKVATFSGILKRSLNKIVALQHAPVHVEFAPDNAGLRRFEIERVEQGANRIDIRLSEAKATCKPAFAFKGATGTPLQSSGCCA